MSDAASGLPSDRWRCRSYPEVTCEPIPADLDPDELPAHATHMHPAHFERTGPRPGQGQAFPRHGCNGDLEPPAGAPPGAVLSTPAARIEYGPWTGTLWGWWCQDAACRQDPRLMSCVGFSGEEAALRDAKAHVRRFHAGRLPIFRRVPK